MKPLWTTVLGIVVASALGVWLLLTYEPRTAIPEDVARNYSRNQKIGTLRPGWVTRSVRRDPDRTTRIVHRVEVAAEIAGDLLIADRGDREERVGKVVCPGGDHEIWEQLTSRQDVEVALFSEQGDFAVVSCRSAVR